MMNEEMEMMNNEEMNEYVPVPQEEGYEEEYYGADESASAWGLAKGLMKLGATAGAAYLGYKFGPKIGGWLDGKRHAHEDKKAFKAAQKANDAALEKEFEERRKAFAEAWKEEHGHPVEPVSEEDDSEE